MFKRLYATLQQQNLSAVDVFDEPDSQLPFIGVNGWFTPSFVFGDALYSSLDFIVLNLRISLERNLFRDANKSMLIPGNPNLFSYKQLYLLPNEKILTKVPSVGRDCINNLRQLNA